MISKSTTGIPSVMASKVKKNLYPSLKLRNLWMVLLKDVMRVSVRQGMKTVYFLPIFIMKYSSEPCNTSSLHIFILNYSNEPCNTSILPIFILKYSNEPCNTSILPNKQHILKQSTNFRNVLPTGHISNFSIFNYRLILKTLLYQGLFLILILTNCIKHSFAQNNPFWNNQLISEMSFR